MPTATFEDEDLIRSIKNETGCCPHVIVRKKINKEGKLEVFWK